VGLFYESQPVESVLHQYLARAYASDAMDDGHAAALAAQTVNDVKAEVLAARQFKPWRVVIAFAIFGALVGGGIASDAVGLQDSRAALYGFAGSVFGIVVGFLGSEKSTS
jgi:hypothetical protein